MPIHVKRLLRQQINSHFFNGIVCTVLGVMLMRTSHDMHSMSFLAAAIAFGIYLPFSIVAMQRTFQLVEKL